MTRRERLIENYEDAYFALLMEDVAQAEGRRLEKLNLELRLDESVVVPEELNRRCYKIIERHFSRDHKRTALRSARKVLNYVACLVAILALLFTSAFAISEDFRVATLNLIITVNEKYTQLDMESLNGQQEAVNKNEIDGDGYFEYIQVKWIPDGYEYLSGEYDYQAVFGDRAEQWIIIDRFDGDFTYNVDTEGAEIIEKVEINGNSGLRIVKNGQAHIAIADTEKNIFIDITSSEAVPSDVVDKVAQNIFVIK